MEETLAMLRAHIERGLTLSLAAHKVAAYMQFSDVEREELIAEYKEANQVHNWSR